MADKIRFLTGSLTDLENKSISRGEVYFAIDGDKGKILFDAPINQTTTKRILMGGDSEHADQAEEAKYALYDKGGKDIRTYVASISLDTPGTSLIVKNGKGDTLSTLSPKFLPLTGGKITGELYTDSLTTGDLLVNGSARFVNTILGNIETADKWKTARNFITNLGSTSKAKVDGSQAEYNIGVTGILPVTNGGTGKNNGKDAANYFLNSLTTGSSNPVDNDYYISQYVNGGTTTTTFHRRPMSALWGYIKTKIKDVLILDETSYNGNAATADKWKNKSNFITNLGSTTKASVDGSQAEYNIGITGTLPIENGGTGATTAAKARENLSTLAALKPSGQSYYVMAAPDGSDNVWIRTTSQGLLPYQSGAAGSGHGNIGTSSWYFKDAYIDNIYGNAASATKLKTARKIITALNSESGGSFDGSTDVTIGVSGILPVSHGGTGQNDLSKVTVGNADKLDNYHADSFKFLTYKYTSVQNANNNYIWIARLTPMGGYQGGSITINITGRYFENFNIKAHIQTGQYPYNSSSIKIYIDSNKTPNTNMHAYYIKNIGTSDDNPDSYDIFVNTTEWGILYYKVDNVINLKYVIKNTLQTGFDPTTATEISYINQATEALKADKWTTSRTFITALNSESHASVDGTANVTIGVSGILPVSHGGTGTTSVANIQAGKDGDGNTISSTYLKLSGGTMTGNISYKGSKGTHSMIRFIDNTTDANGNGISIGGGGSVTIGAGESSQSFTPSGGDETLYLLSDGSIKFYTYCDTIGNKRGVILDTSRNFYPDANNNGSVGTSSNKWASMYASTFYGNLSGTASYATRDSNGQIITDTYLTNVYVSDTTKLYKTIGTSGDSNKNILIGSFTPLDADGLINIKYLPQGALERMHIVANKAARLALTTANVQKGDTVYEDDTGSMYYVYDDTKLNSEDGYRLYSAGTATRVNWSGVQNRPHVVGSSSQTNVISLDAAKTTFTIRVVEKTGTESSYTLTPNFLPLTGGTITGELYVDGRTTLASLLVNGDAKFVNTIQGNISGNAGSATKWATEKAFYIADAEAKHTSSPQVNIDGSKSSYTLHLPSTIKATLEGNADSANKVNHNLIYKKHRNNSTQNFNGSADVEITPTYADLHPVVSKKYESTSYYATSSGSWDTSSWYMISVKPDSWYKPWTIKVKFHSYAPGYANVDSVTYSTISGRQGSTVYANWNEHYDSGHYYIPIYTMKKAGFDAGYGHAIGISILYGTGYTNSSYYRTFEVELLDYDGCTVTVLDTPTKWNQWKDVSSTSVVGNSTYYNGLSNFDAYNRGLRESGDDNDYANNAAEYYYRAPAGSKGYYGNNIVTLDSTGRLSGFTSTPSTANNKTQNNVTFQLNAPFYYYTSSTNRAENALCDYNQLRFLYTLIDCRYSFNIAQGSLTINKPLYLVGILNSDNSGYILPDTWWTQTLPTSDDGRVYIYMGTVYPDGNAYRISWDARHPAYWYKNGKLRPMGDTGVYIDAPGSKDQILSSNGYGFPKWVNRSSITIGKATQLENSRTFITALNSESAGSFNGTANVTLGVSGTLPTNHGGTGNTTFTALRAIYAETATKLSSSGHYMSSSKLAINSTTEPGYQFYVNGSTYLNGKVYINTKTDTAPFYITKDGTETEAVAMSVNDSTYTIAYTNNDTSNQIRIRMINTDTKDGTKDNTTDWSFYFNSSGQFLPTQDNSGSIGTSTQRWANIYASNFRGLADKATSDGSGHNIEDTYLKRSGGTMTGTINSQIVQPKTNNTYTLGGSSNRWSTLYSVNIDNSGSWTWYGGQNFILKATANNQEWSFDQCSGSTSYTGTYSHFYSSKNDVSIIRFYTDDNQVQIPSTGFMGIGGAGDASYKLKVTGNTYLTGTLYVGGNSTFNSNLTVNTGGKVKIENTTDSTYSEDTNAAVDIKGGISIDKQISAKSVRIDNNSKDKGCTLVMNLDLNCLEFVFN